MASFKHSRRNFAKPTTAEPATITLDAAIEMCDVLHQFCMENPKKSNLVLAHMQNSGLLHFLRLAVQDVCRNGPECERGGEEGGCKFWHPKDEKKLPKEKTCIPSHPPKEPDAETTKPVKPAKKITKKPKETAEPANETAKPANSNVCRYGNKCTNSKCKREHVKSEGSSPTTAESKRSCFNGAKCRDIAKCPFNHYCIFPNCRNPDGCKYLHPPKGNETKDKAIEDKDKAVKVEDKDKANEDDETEDDETEDDESEDDESEDDETPKDEATKDVTPKDEATKDETPKDERKWGNIPLTTPVVSDQEDA